MSIQSIKDLFHKLYRMEVEVTHKRNRFYIEYREVKASIPDKEESPQEIVKPLLKAMIDYIEVDKRHASPTSIFHKDTFPPFSGEKRYRPEYEISMVRYTDKAFGLEFYKYYTFNSSAGEWVEERKHFDTIHSILYNDFAHKPTKLIYSVDKVKKPQANQDYLLISIPEESWGPYTVARTTDLIQNDNFCSFILERIDCQTSGNQKSRSKYIFTLNLGDEVGRQIEQQVIELEEPWWGDEVLSSNDLMQNPYNATIHNTLSHLPPKYKSDNIWITYYDIFYIRLGIVWMPQSRYYCSTYAHVFPEHIQEEIGMIIGITSTPK